MSLAARVVRVPMRVAVVVMMIGVVMVVVIVSVRFGSLIPDPRSRVIVSMPVRLLVRVHGHGLFADDAELRRANAGSHHLFSPD